MSSKPGSVNESGAAIVCVHVAKLGYPILRAERDEPTMPEDTGWQFLCNTGQPEREDEAQVWALSEVLEDEPSLSEFMSLAAPAIIVREDRHSRWTAVDSRLPT